MDELVEVPVPASIVVVPDTEQPAHPAADHSDEQPTAAATDVPTLPAVHTLPTLPDSDTDDDQPPPATRVKLENAYVLEK